LFPGGYEVPTDDWDNTNIKELLRLTEQYIRAGDAPHLRSRDSRRRLLL